MTKTRSLTPKQKRFCEKYVECGNKSEAYKIAYNAENMTYTSINAAVYELFKNPLIVAYVGELTKENQKVFVHTLNDSLKIDFEIVEKYKRHLAIVENEKSTQKKLEVSQRVLAVIGVQGFNSAQERISKKMGFYVKDKEKTQIVYTVEVTPEEAREIEKALENDV